MKTLWIWIITGIMFVPLPVAQAAALHDIAAGQEPDLAATLTLQLDQWDRLQKNKKSLEASFQTLDAQSGPVHDERYWWNPFLQNARASRAEEANRILLQLQTVERELSDLQGPLLEKSTRFAHGMAAASGTPTETQQNLWERCDAWRIPVILQEPDWASFEPEKIAALTPELRENRLRYLRERKQNWLAFLEYLEKTRDNPIHAARLDTVDRWNNRVSMSMKKVDEIFDGLNR